MRRWWYMLVSVLVAVCFVSLTACESWWGGETEDEKTEVSDSGSDDADDDDEETTQLDPGQLRDVVWYLKSWGKTGKETKIIGGTTVSLEFVDKDDLKGYGGCANYKGEYEAATDGTMDTDDVKPTAINPACAVATANQQDEYLDNLKHVKRYEFESDGDLRLFYEDEFMVFE